MRRPSQGQLYVIGTLAMVLLAMALTWASGPFPVPWNDELVFTDIGHRFLRTGQLNEAFWALFDPRFGQGLVNTPPLYPIAVGLLQLLTGGSLLAMRLAHGTLLIGGLALWVRSRGKVGPLEEGPGHLTQLLFLLSLVTNPYFLRAAFFIRPDGFILLAFLWLAGHIWSGTFLFNRNNALKAGAIMGLAGQTHFSALVLIPLFLLGLWNGFRRQGRSIFTPFWQATLLGMALMGPYLAWFLPRLPEWWRLVRNTQGAQKYIHFQPIGSYLWPPDALMDWIPIHQWAPAAWGSDSAYYLWILCLVLLPLVSVRIALRESSPSRGFTFWALGALGTWFFIRLPEMWFSTLGAVTIQALLTLHFQARLAPRTMRVACGGLALVQLCAHGLFLDGSGLPSWSEHRATIGQIQTLLSGVAPEGPSQIYVSALPDPSVDLMAVWPNLQVTRGMDFPSYQPRYEAQVLKEPQAWILGEPLVRSGRRNVPQVFLFDWGHVLAQAVQRGELELHEVPWGDYRIWVALRPASVPLRPLSKLNPDAEFKATPPWPPTQAAQP